LLIRSSDPIPGSASSFLSGGTNGSWHARKRRIKVSKPRRYDFELDDPDCGATVERADGDYVVWSDVGGVYEAAMALWDKVETIGIFVNADRRIENELLNLWWACRLARERNHA
jgi:hypothetical protein